MENTPFMDTATGKRAVANFAEDEQAALEGRQLISLEAQDEIGPEAGIFAYVTENFDQFLRYLRSLAPSDQEKLLAYYSLQKTQNQLAVVFKSTQTVCSFQLRASVRCMAALISWEGQPPSTEIMEPLLAKIGHSKIDGHSLAEVISEYAACRSFVKVARKRNIHRPLIRRSISKASKVMIGEEQPPDVQALGWWTFKLIDKANPLGRGLGRRAKAKLGDIEIELPDLCGHNRVSTDDPDLEALFQSRANF